MSPYFTELGSVEAVNARMAPEADPRLAEIMASLVKHLHAFTKETQLTKEEWEVGIDFLTKTGKLCSGERQEFILLSDTLGLSMLVDAINNRRPEGATENTVVGPFHVADAPERVMGANISLDRKGESCLFEGRVIDLDGKPVKSAHVDVWSDNADGYYDVQQTSNRGGTTGASSSLGPTVATASSGSSRCPTRSRTTVRSARCLGTSADIRTDRRTCTTW